MAKLVLAGCVILNEARDAILLLKRKKTGWYELPGGKIDGSESPEAAATRELKEELAVDVDIIRRLGTKDFEQNGRSFSYIWFLAKIRGFQEPRLGEPDAYDNFAFIPISELSKHKLSPNMQNLAIELGRRKL